MMHLGKNYCDFQLYYSYIAKTGDILEIDGWSKELKVHKHQDLFLKLTAAGSKVVRCSKFNVLNVHSGEAVQDSEAYNALRYKIIKEGSG